MRDLVLLCCFLVLLFYAFRKPFIGLAVWVWVALIYPGGWVYGFAGGIRYNLIIAGVAITSFLFSKKEPGSYSKAILILGSLFFFWTLLSSIFTINHPPVVWEQFERFAKVYVLFVFIQLAVSRKIHLETLVWAVVLSLGFFGMVNGLKYINSGGNHVITGLGNHVFSDRNFLALGMNMALPMMFYFLRKPELQRPIKLVLAGVFACTVIAILGTSSRGGLLALLVVFFMLTRYSRRRLPLLVFSGIIALAALPLLPDSWFERMDTISTATDDSSFQGRMDAWKVSTAIAIDNPITGGGFLAVQNYQQWLYYTSLFQNQSWFGDVPDYGFGKAAHSMYFQVLGEHGFIGLFLYLLLLLAVYRRLKSIANNTDETAWQRELAEMLLIAFWAMAIGGAALNFAVTDMTMILFALASCLPTKELRTNQRQYPGVISQ